MWYTDKKLEYEKALMNKFDVLDLLKSYSKHNILSVLVKSDPICWNIRVFNLNIEQDTNRITIEKMTTRTEKYLKDNLKNCRNVNFIY